MAEDGTMEVIREDDGISGMSLERISEVVLKIEKDNVPLQTTCSTTMSTSAIEKSSISHINSVYLDDVVPRFVLVGAELKENTEFHSVLKHFKESEVLFSETGLEHVHDAEETNTVFILSCFQGEVYHKLHKAEARIIGPPVVYKCIKYDENLPYCTRPRYCNAMQGITVCFNGFRDRDELIHLVELVHHMGGSVRKDMTLKVTHLIANSPKGTKYRQAISFGRPIMSEDWIRYLWEEKENIEMKAENEKMLSYRLKPFFRCCLSFYGFPEEEQKHMEEFTIENGGVYTEFGSEDSSHLIVNNHTVKELPSVTVPDHVVKEQWFWESIQLEACVDESMHVFQMASTQKATPKRSSYSGKSRKRKRLDLAQLIRDGEVDSPFMSAKRRSSELGGLSLSPNSFLDASNTPDKSALSEISHESKDNKQSKVSPRLQVVTELMQTEKNYVGILNTILTLFKEQIEKQDQFVNRPLLSSQDVKIIFGNIPSIYQVHCKLLDELSSAVDNWNDDICVGDIYLRHADLLLKAYPPYVNFFEQSKESIIRADKTNPRFHAFLKVCLTKPECGRQTLTELLIRPIQRLPSVSLLLNDIMKHTPSSSPDQEKLTKALAAVKNIMTLINEDKRKTESQVAMFDILNDIDNCPAHILSSHRCFKERIDVIELSDGLSGKGEHLSLFLFTDIIEICKRRTKILNTTKSPANRKTPQKAFKHIELLPLSFIKRVLDIAETDDCQNAFALICKNNTEFKERLFSFAIESEEDIKAEFLTVLCKTAANVTCRPDFESLLTVVDGQALNISTKELGSNTFGKAKRFGKRVSRAFSFNKTPGKLKRAVSSVASAFSPFVGNASNSGFGSPGHELRGRRLASSIDLTDQESSPIQYVDSDTVSLGAYSLKEDMSPYMMANTTPKLKRLTKYTTLGSSAAGKYL